MAPRRRVEDDLEVAFQRALATGQIEVASDILAMLETWRARHACQSVPERRAGGINLRLMREELEGLKKSHPR